MQNRFPKNKNIQKYAALLSKDFQTTLSACIFVRSVPQKQVIPKSLKICSQNPRKITAKEIFFSKSRGSWPATLQKRETNYHTGISQVLC